MCENFNIKLPNSNPILRAVWGGIG